MNRGLLASLGMAVLVVASAVAAPPLLLSKDGRGTILNSNVAVVLAPNGASDQTKELIPAGSKLVSEHLMNVVSETGIGWFKGPAAIIGPEGKPILLGVLHGTIGIKATREPGADVKAPGVWVGSFDPIPVPHLGSTDPSKAADAAASASTESGECGEMAPWEIHFWARELPTMGPIPMFEARLDGLIPPPPPPPPPPAGRIVVRPTKERYTLDEPVVAIVRNEGTGPAAAIAPQSWCTIVRLEQKVEDKWQMVGTCNSLVPIPPTIIAPRGEVKVALPPRNTEKLQAGIYRMVVVWASLGRDGTPLDEKKESISLPIRVGNPPPVGRVLVYSPKPLYEPGELVMAVVANKTDKPVVGYKWFSFCSLVTMEKRTETGWKPVEPCMLTGGPPMTIPAGESVRVPMTGDPAKPAKLDPGAYRFTFKFQMADADGKPAGDAATVISEPFRIGAPPPPPPPPPTGKVLIFPNKPGYAVTEPIVAVIANGTESKVRAFDLESFCTIVQLETLKDGKWMMVGGCPLDRMPMPVILEPKTETKVALPPDAANVAPKWEPGAYRLTLTFAFLKADGTTSEIITISSAPFPVGDLTPPPPPGVGVKAGKPEYRPGELVVGYIGNGLVTPIRLFDHNSFCTIVTMERLDPAGAWKPTYGCDSARPTSPVVLKAKSETKVGLPEVAIPEFKYEPGTYRLSITFAPIGPDGVPTARDVTRTSPPFAILGEGTGGPGGLGPARLRPR